MIRINKSKRIAHLNELLDSPNKIEDASWTQEDSRSNNDSDFNPEKQEEVQAETLNYEEEKGKRESDPQTQNLDANTNPRIHSISIRSSKKMKTPK